MDGAAQSELDALEASWAARGVEIDAQISRDSWARHNLHLSKISVDRGHRGEGLGTRAMQDLTALADRRGLLMTLSPSTDFGGSSVARLKRFYRRFGFVSNKGRNKDFTLSDAMYRLPAPTSMGASRPREGSEGTAYIDPVGHGWYKVRWWSEDEQRYYFLIKKPSKAEAIAYARARGMKPVDMEGPELGARKQPWNPERVISKKELKRLQKEAKLLHIPMYPAFVDAYLEAALWASSVPDGEKPLDDQGYSISDFDQEAVNQAVDESNDFIRENLQLLEAVGTMQQHGHDFWLTRNRHGAGFFDRGYGNLGKLLTKSAHAYGGKNAYAGEDGKVRFE